MFEIYGYLRDPLAWSARFAAEEKGIEYRWIPGDVAFPDPRAARNNPTGRSPLARHENLVLSDAFNIQLYIDEAFPGRALMPPTPAGRAAVRMFVASLEALVAVIQNGSGPASFNRRSFKRMDDVFSAVDDQLKSSQALWLDGKLPGQRDISFLPLLSELETMESSFSIELGALSDYWKRAMAYAPFQKTNYRSAEMLGHR